VNRHRQRLKTPAPSAAKVFSARASGTEATLRATPEAQQAALDASVSVASTAAEGERDALKAHR